MKPLFLLRAAALVISPVAANITELPDDLPCGVAFSVRNSTRNLLAALRDPTIDPGALGAADVFGSNAGPGPKPWLRGSNLLVTIPYCYREPYERASLAWRVEEAIKIWENALGGQASKDTGHAVVFKETTDQGRPLYCYDLGASNRFKWNDDIPYETVSVEAPEPWEMFMRVGHFASSVDVAHELGHVLGMAHEHQRLDRDKYVKYNCSNLRDYYRRLHDATAMDPSITPDKLCNDFYTALRYAFTGTQFIRGTSPGAWSRGWPVHSASDAYDYDSIMHYATQGASRIGCAANQLDKCALTKYKNGPGRPWEVMPIPRNTVPSGEDLSWVRNVYPWKE